MTPPHRDDPCVAPMVHFPVPGPERVRVVQVMATGTNGGAQEHVINLVGRLDREFYDVSVVSLSSGSAVRKLQRMGIDVTVIDDPDDAIATATLAAHLADVRADVIHNHMYRAEIVGTKAAIALGDAGHRRPWVVSTVHSSRVRSSEDQAELRRLTPQIDHVIAVSHAIEQKLVAEGRDGAPVSLIYNGVDLERYDHQEACCTLREEYGMDADAEIVGVVGRLELEKGHPTLLEAWPLVLEQRALRLPADRGRGEPPGRAPPDRARPGRRAPRHLHRAPRRHPGGHGGLRRGGAAVLPRGAGPHDPRGDGALAARGRVATWAASPR